MADGKAKPGKAEKAPKGERKESVEDALRAEKEKGPMRAPPDPLIGEHIANCWIVHKLGEGGFGAVYRAIDETRHKPVALKVVRPERAGSEEVIKKFLRGCIAAAQLEHPNIVAIYRVGRDEKRKVHYLVMEHLKGRTLQSVLEEKGPLDPCEVIPWLLQAAEGLHVAHEKQIVHRDVKPDNIMIGDDGIVKVTDLGLARILNKEQKTTRVMGTPHFMAPEQFEGKGMDRRTDVYAFGITLYYVLSRAFPYEGKTSMEIVFSILTTEPRSLTTARPGTHPELWAIVKRMIARIQTDRYPTMKEAQEALRAFHERNCPRKNGEPTGSV